MPSIPASSAYDGSVGTVNAANSSAISLGIKRSVPSSGTSSSSSAIFFALVAVKPENQRKCFSDAGAAHEKYRRASSVRAVSISDSSPRGDGVQRT